MPLLSTLVQTTVQDFFFLKKLYLDAFKELRI
jgi:hypothetical protein